MALPADQIEELKGYFPNLAAVEDGGTTFVLIKDLPLPPSCEPPVVDALLCPQPRDGYPSRLYVSAEVRHKGPGTNMHVKGIVIANRRWWAISWNTNAPTQRLLGMVTAHLLAFTCKQS
jgi:hypothetical protein